MTNILTALYNLKCTNVTTITNQSSSSIKINSVGESLEHYIRDLFSNTLHEEDYNQRVEAYEKTFSYLGNQNNPPDIMIKYGDALEIKKIQSINSSIALNSSYPKNKLLATDPLLTSACKKCEEWQEKDLIYVVGVVKQEQLFALWFVYGNCYAASNGTYEKVKEAISSGVNGLNGISFSKTKELGRVNKVDPLGITNLRIRGMWMIENPNKVFQNITNIDSGKITINALMLDEKYNSFSDMDRSQIESLQSDTFIIKNVKIMSPDNPAKMLIAKLIRFTK